jgi:hypothetical protein
MRSINHYRLDGDDPGIVASGHTVFDFGMAKQIIRAWILKSNPHRANGLRLSRGRKLGRGGHSFVLEMGHASDIIQKSRTGGNPLKRRLPFRLWPTCSDPREKCAPRNTRIAGHCFSTHLRRREILCWTGRPTYESGRPENMSCRGCGRNGEEGATTIETQTTLASYTEPKHIS